MIDAGCSISYEEKKISNNLILWPTWIKIIFSISQEGTKKSRGNLDSLLTQGKRYSVCHQISLKVLLGISYSNKVRRD